VLQTGFLLLGTGLETSVKLRSLCLVVTFTNTNDLVKNTSTQKQAGILKKTYR